MEKEIEVAVKWWVEKLGGFSPLKQDIGDAKLESDLAFLGVLMGAHRAEPTKVKEFGLALARLMHEQPADTYWLDVDYDPMGLLGQAAEEAGIFSFQFPYKTHMHVHKGKVIVACGYGQPYETIYEAKEDEHAA